MPTIEDFHFVILDEDKKPQLIVKAKTLLMLEQKICDMIPTIYDMGECAEFNTSIREITLHGYIEPAIVKILGEDAEVLEEKQIFISKVSVY